MEHSILISTEKRVYNFKTLDNEIVYFAVFKDNNTEVEEFCGYDMRLDTYLSDFCSEGLEKDITEEWKTYSYLTKINLIMQFGDCVCDLTDFYSFHNLSKKGFIKTVLKYAEF